MENANPAEPKYKKNRVEINLHGLSEITPVPVYKHQQAAEGNFPIAPPRPYGNVQVPFAATSLEFKKKPKLIQEV